MRGLLWALDARPAGDPDVAAEALLLEIPGARVDTRDEKLVQALLARGARLRRRAHDMEYDLSAGVVDVAEPAGYDFAPVIDTAPLAPVHFAAFPPGHVDHRSGMDVAAELAKVLAGEVIGPFLPEASWQAEYDGGIAGAVLVVDRPEFGPMSARAWMCDLFVHPEHQGRSVGDALIRRALFGAREAGFGLMGLVVTEGNPARRTYERVGFRVVYSGATVDLPR